MINRTFRPRKRGGTTLTEVLVSLAVMSIGVVTLATIFPISVLRSVQATQLTNATNLRFNAEATLAVWPLAKVAPEWQPGTVYSAGAYVAPTAARQIGTSRKVLYCILNHTSGTIEPDWNEVDQGPTPATGTALWTTYSLGSPSLGQFGGGYIVDPLGAWLVESAFRNTANGDFFGNDGATSPIPRQVIRAFNGFTTGVSQADDLVTLPDSWLQQAESNLITYTAGTTTCTLGKVGTDFSTTTPIGQSRIILFDDTGRVSHERPLTSVSYVAGTQTGTVDWATSLALPTNFVPTRARIESRERRYTFLLSIRTGTGGSLNMDVVVFFRRPFSGKDEQLFPATFTKATDFGFDGLPGIAGKDDDLNAATDDATEVGSIGSDDIERNWAIVQYDVTGAKPFLKKGGFVTDADNLRWYRIVDYFEGTTPANVLSVANIPTTAISTTVEGPAYGANTRSILLRLDSPVLATGPQPTNPGDPPNGRAMLMRGIVDVFPIRTPE